MNNPMGMPNLTGFPGEGAMKAPAFSGPINTPVPGRTDRHHMRVKNGSYVIPADVVSGVGQGNTQAGHAAFNALFPKTKLPHGHLPSGHAPREARMAMRHSGVKGLHMPMAHGGEADEGEEDPEVVTAGGEHVLTPEQIIARYGDLDKGHDLLDQLVEGRRAKTIKEMQKLPGPKK